MSYDFITEDMIPVVIYDVTIEDIEERKAKAVTYDSIKKACAKLDLGYNSIKRSINLRQRVFCPRLNKPIAIRYKNTKQ